MIHSRRAFFRQDADIGCRNSRPFPGWPGSRQVLGADHVEPRGGAAAADRRQPALCRGPHDLVRRGPRHPEGEDGRQAGAVCRRAVLRGFAGAGRADLRPEHRACLCHAGGRQYRDLGDYRQPRIRGRGPRHQGDHGAGSRQLRRGQGRRSKQRRFPARSARSIPISAQRSTRPGPISRRRSRPTPRSRRGCCGNPHRFWPST